ncbi:MAG: transposase family protein [Clostridiales bacterium]|nr:transposase family protein [Clostridiales bacterium]
MRDRRWHKIKDIVIHEPDIYDKKVRLSLLRNASEEHNACIDNLYDLLDLYWRFGKSKNALIPAYSRSGAKGKDREKYSVRQSSGKASRKELSATDRFNFERAIRKYYLTREKRSLKSTYERLLQEFYTKKTDYGKLKLLEPSEVPTFRQFQYWYYKNSDIVNATKKRDGERAFELNSRAVLGKSDYGLMGPGAQFQVDATVGDVYLVSQFDRSNIIGRPVLYFVIDVFSRLVVGMSVGLEGPSWNALAGAIINMASDKVDFCKQYDIEISESEWPCRHIPASLLGDRGELASKNADALVNMFGIRIVNAPPYRADLKGIVEQHFRTINTNAVALLPGSVKPDMSKRGGRDYRLDATLDIRQLTQIIIKCVLYYNNFHYMEFFEKSEAIIAAGVDAIPVKLWEWGVENYSGALRVFPEENVKFAVLPTGSATVTEKGIRFKGLYYACDRAKSQMWFEKARAKKYWSITISYDPRDLTNIFIWDNNLKQYDTCYLLGWNSKNAGKALAEIIYEQQKERLEAKRLKATATEAKVNLNAEIDSIVTEAKQMVKSTSAKSKKERISNIRENRTVERAKIRSGEEISRIAESEIPTSALSSHKSDEEMSPILRMIKEKAEEKLKNG